MTKQSETTNSLTADLQRIERRFELALRDLRLLRAEIAKDSTSKGVLGSRGLTQFVVEQLVHHSQTHRGSTPGLAIPDLLRLAETAGYQVPTARTFSKRLNERSYRIGDIKFDHEAQVWFWPGEQLANEER